MTTFLATFSIFALAILGMAIGVLAGRRCLQGSCGGLAGMHDEQDKSLCESCTNPSAECRVGMESAHRDDVREDREETVVSQG
jgi:hypothetical protein